MNQITSQPGSAQNANSSDTGAMCRPLTASHDDGTKLDIRLHQEIKDLVAKAVREEKSSGSKKASISRMITWVLEAVSTALEDVQKPKIPK